MPNEILIRAAKFTRDLLVVDESTIKIGRENNDRDDHDKDYIVVDALGKMIQTGYLETFDPDLEQLSIGGVWAGTITLDFYGKDTYTRAINFGLLARSQKAYELKRSLGIAIYNATGPTDVKALTGSEYDERTQLEFNVQISFDTAIDTLRIDTTQLDIRSE